MHDNPLIGYPGDGMKIERIPLPDDLLRLECIKVASQSNRGRTAAQLVNDASVIEAHVRYGRRKNEEGFAVIGPECFVDNDHLVISFMGENFYAACGNYVRRDENLTTWTCVKRKGHPSTTCEDYSGSIRDMSKE